MRSLGPYILTRRLGVGGMGEVWMGQRAVLDGAAKTVAIKLARAERVDASARKRFLDEARLSMLLTNSNIVQVFDAGEDRDGTCYLAMEWVDGLDLAQLGDRLRASGERLPLPVVAYVVGELLKALAYAHEFELDGVERCVVHRDISPHNVMLSVFGEVKLTDFGIARLSSEDTSGAQVKGKLRYMPPEQLRGHTREPTLDLFAVGAVLHELLDGEKFRGDAVDHARLYGLVLDGEVPALRRDDVPDELARLREGLLAARPEDRTASARAAHALLSAWPGYRDAKFELEDIVRAHVDPRPAGSGSSSLDQPSGGTMTDAGLRFQGSATEAISDTDERERDEIGETDEDSRSGTERGASSSDCCTSESESATPEPAPVHAEPRTAVSNRAILIAGMTLALIGVILSVFALGVSASWWRTPPEPPVVASRPASVEQPPTIDVADARPVESPPSEPTPIAGETSEEDTGPDEESDTGEAQEPVDEPTPAAPRSPTRVACKFLVATSSGTKLQPRDAEHPLCEELRDVTNLGVQGEELRLRVAGKLLNLRPGQPRRFDAPHKACWSVSGQLAAKYLSLTVEFGARRCG